MEQLPLFPPEPRDVVYIQTDGEFIKIGRTSRAPSTRRRELQTGNPRPLHYLALLPGANERRVQSLAEHVRGEWYRMTPAIQSLIDAANALRRIA
jgi:hypothetical protein